MDFVICKKKLFQALRPDVFLQVVNQSGDNRGYSAHTSISLTVPPASLNFAIRLSALCSN